MTRLTEDLRALAEAVEACEWELPINAAVTCIAAATEIERLATSEADVARYEFLRQHKARASSLHMDGTSAWHFTGGWPPLIGPTLDAAIDAAIATWNSDDD